MNRNTLINLLCVGIGLIIACGLIYFLHELVLLDFTKNIKNTIIYLEVVAVVVLMTTYLVGEIANLIKWMISRENTEHLSLSWRQIFLVMVVLGASISIMVMSLSFVSTFQ